MERLTEEKQIGPFAALKDKAEAVPGAFGSYDCLYAHMVAVTRLKEYEDIGLEPEEIKVILERYHAFRSAISDETGQPMVSWTRAGEICRADKDGRLVVLEPSPKEGEPKPPCFYNDMGQTFCLGLARGECDDEPIDRCKECWYCESTRAEAEAALRKGGEDT